MDAYNAELQRELARHRRGPRAATSWYKTDAGHITNNWSGSTACATGGARGASTRKATRASPRSARCARSGRERRRRGRTDASARTRELVARTPRRGGVGIGRRARCGTADGRRRPCRRGPRSGRARRSAGGSAARSRRRPARGPTRAAGRRSRARREEERRHADAREVELVGAVEMAALGERVVGEVRPWASAAAAATAVERRLAEARRPDVAGAAPDVAAVDVQVRRPAAPAGNGGMRDEVRRAEQALLLGGDGEEENRAPRRAPAAPRTRAPRRASARRRRRCRARRCRSRRLPLRVGLDAEVVVVRGVDDDLARAAPDRCRAAAPTTFAVRVAAHARCRSAQRGRDAERHRRGSRAAAPRRPARRGRGRRARTRRARGVLGRSTPRHLEAAAVAARREARVLAAPRRLHRLPRIARRASRVQDDRADARRGARRSRTCRSSGRSRGGACRRTAPDPSRDRC